MRENLFEVFSNSPLCCGVSVYPYVVLSDGTRLEAEYDVIYNKEDKTCLIHAGYDDFKDEIFLQYCDSGIVCRRNFKNISGHTQKIKELSFEISGIDFGEEPEKDYFYHLENPRMFEVMTFPIDYNRTSDDAKNSEFDVQAGNRWAEPGIVSERIGVSPYQPFPAILVSNYNTNFGIVHGTLSQRIFYHNYVLCHEDKKVKMTIYSSFKGIASLSAEPGRILTDEWYLGVTHDADNIEKIFEGYTEVLRKKLPTGYGKTSINRDNVIWGTWNDGLFRDISEEKIIKEARYLKDNFPTVKWIQIDDGYAVYDKSAHGIGVTYEGESGIDYSKFPGGLAGLTNRIHAIGLKTAIWIGGFCPHETKIYNEHPEWFADYSYRTSGTSPLDVSRQDVRRYMSDSAKYLLSDNNFDGVKLDFWSYIFEDSHDLCQYSDKSGYEHRTWWLRTLRDCIPADGYMQSGYDIAMGNPFLGEYFTNYRYGIDIACGNWENVKSNYLWGMACFATHTGDIIVPNSDSIGLFPGLNDTEAMFAINYCLATHSMVEIAGLLSKEDNDPERIEILRKAVCNPNNGQDIFFYEYDYRTSHYNVPEIVFFKTPHFSQISGNICLPLVTVGMFNIDDEAKNMSFSLNGLGLDEGTYVLTDVWTGEQIETCDLFTSSVQAHGSKLIAINKRNSISIYDANVRINNVYVCKNVLEAEIDYKAKDVYLTLNKAPMRILSNKDEIDFTYSMGKVTIPYCEKGVLRFEF